MWPRPYRTLLISGWEIDHGSIAKEGIVRISESDQPGGVVVVADCSLTNTTFPPEIFERGDETMFLTALSILVLSKPDVQEMLDEGEA